VCYTITSPLDLASSSRERKPEGKGRRGKGRERGDEECSHTSLSLKVALNLMAAN